MSFFKKNKICVTHDGGFHADDLFATAILRIILDDNIKIVRTRDSKIIDSADYVYDVGGIYDENLNRFDHHQKDFSEKRENGIPYSSFGLVWKKYGEQICGSKNVADEIDRKVVQAIDASDNGVDMMTPIFKDSIPYRFSEVFLCYTPTWKEDVGLSDDVFIKQSKEVKKFLLRLIKTTMDDEEAKSIMIKAYEESIDKRIIILENNFPRYLYQGVMSRMSEPLFLVYPSSNGKHWNVEAVRKLPWVMESRKSLPESWRGFMDGDDGLKKVTGISDVIFCHRSGFIISATSKESAIKLAEKALIA